VALLEAMACGLPSVATQCMGGVEEWLRPGENVALVPTDDFPRLTAAMADLMQDPAQRRRLGENAVKAVTSLALERIVGLWEALLARIGF
jgi:glycosyltransferase involved in cell wall biosynthesis